MTTNILGSVLGSKIELAIDTYNLIYEDDHVDGQTGDPVYSSTIRALKVQFDTQTQTFTFIAEDEGNSIDYGKVHRGSDPNPEMALKLLLRSLHKQACSDGIALGPEMNVTLNQAHR